MNREHLFISAVLLATALVGCGGSDSSLPQNYGAEAPASRPNVILAEEEVAPAASPGVLAGLKLQWPEDNIQEQYQSYGHYTGGHYTVAVWQFCPGGRYKFWTQEADAGLNILNDFTDRGVWMEASDATGSTLMIAPDTGGTMEMSLATLPNGQIVIDDVEYVVVDTVGDSVCD
jgi:hypothetical protein